MAAGRETRDLVALFSVLLPLDPMWIPYLDVQRGMAGASVDRQESRRGRGQPEAANRRCACP